MRSRALFVVAILGTVAGALQVRAAEPTTVNLTVKDHRFDRQEVRVPANTPLIIKVKNADAAAEEFDSNDLKVEKIMTPGGEITVRVRPLKPGRYEFAGEYNADTANGVIIAE